MYQEGHQPIHSATMYTQHQGSLVTNWYLPAAKDSSPIMQTLSEDHINMQSSSIMPTICKPYQMITSIYSPHQQITSVSVNPDKQVDIIMVICTQCINKYISRHSHPEQLKHINTGPFRSQYSSLSLYPKFQFSDQDALDICLYYYALIIEILHPLI